MVASKLPQVLQLTPSNEIIFQGPFDRVVTSYLELQNPTENRVCFKVKTTAPKRYCVRPNSGIIDPNEKVKIAIMLQPMDQESFAERQKHKFMVQTTTLAEDNTFTTDEIWKSTQPEHIMDSKLRCVFYDGERTGDSTRPVTRPVTPPAAQPTARTATQPAAQPVAQPAARPVARPTSHWSSDYIVAEIGLFLLLVAIVLYYTN